MRSRSLAVVLAAAVVLGPGAVASEAAVIFPFSGSGSSGSAAPSPLTWLVIENFSGESVWGIPGFGEGFAVWPSETSVTDFHITFEARTVDDSFLSETQFSVFLEGEWTRVVNGNTVDFFAPAGTALDLGEEFFVNVTLLGGEGIRTFEAHWTTDAVVVPEPASLLLVGVGLTALGLAATRRRR
jgi:PEP-CTERM motif